MNEIVSLLVVFLGLWGGHWTPWWVVPALVDKENDEKLLLRPLAYGYGCTWIFVGFVLWAAMLASDGAEMISVWSAVRFLALDILVAGLGTMLPRGIRLLKRYQALEGDNKDYEQTIQGR